MKRKRLDRDLWTDITEKRYVQRELIRPAVFPEFYGIAALLYLDRVAKESRWNYPGGYVTICGAGMKWLELLPYDRKYALTAMIGPDGRIVEWYCDLTGGFDFDPDGTACFFDAWLDLIARPPCVAYPEGHLREDDRDELDDALRAGEIDEGLYREILEEAELLKSTLFSDLPRLEKICLTLARELDGASDGTVPVE